MPGFDALAEGAGKLLGAIPELYDDLAKPAVQEVGKTLALPLQAVNALLVNPRKWIANAEYKLQETNVLIANKLKYIDENKLIAPPDYVAVPALQALSYSMDSDDLRDLYANLLAKSMNAETSNSVHPAYVEIIKQFSPIDATLFKHIVSDLSSKNGDIALLNIVVKSNDENDEVVKRFINVVECDEYTLSEIAQSVDNLIRCGLIAVTQYAFISYKRYATSEIIQWKNVQKEYLNNYKVEVEMATAAHITELGKKFYLICCDD